MPTEDLQRLLKKARFVKLKVSTVHAFTCFYGSCSYLFSSVSPKSAIHPCPPWLSALVSMLPGPHMILMPSCACLFSILHMCSCSLHIFSAIQMSPIAHIHAASFCSLDFLKACALPDCVWVLMILRIWSLYFHSAALVAPSGSFAQKHAAHYIYIYIINMFLFFLHFCPCQGFLQSSQGIRSLQTCQRAFHAGARPAIGRQECLCQRVPPWGYSYQPCKTRAHLSLSQPWPPWPGIGIPAGISTDR